MIAAGHSSVGVLVGTVTYVTLGQVETNGAIILLVSFLLGIASHYAADAIPHGHYDYSAANFDKTITMILMLDVVGVYLFLALLSLASTSLFASLCVITGMSGALLPDVFEALIDHKVIKKSKITKKHRHFHYEKVHRPLKTTSPLKNGAKPISAIDVWQLACFVAAIFCIVSIL